MNEVRLSKSKLVEILIRNRKEHRHIFLAAQKKYREAVIEALDEQLKLARDGKTFVIGRITRLIAPEDHTREYDTVLRMLGLSLDDEITLSNEQFANLVEDIWVWSRSWALSNSMYVTSKKLQELSNE